MSKLVHDILWFVSQMTFPVIAVLFFNAVERPRLKPWLNVAIFIPLQSVISVLTIFLDREPWALIYNIILILFALFMYKDKILKRIGIFIIYYSLFAGGDYIAYYLFSLSYKLSDDERVIYSSFFSAALSGLLLLFISHFINLKKLHDFDKGAFVFLLIPLIHVLFASLTVVTQRVYNTDRGHQYIQLTESNVFLVAAISLTLISLIVDILALNQYAKNIDAVKLKAENESLEYTNKLNYQYFSDLKDNETELQKIKHDIGNSLEIVQELIYQSDTVQPTAQQLLDELSETANQIETGFYCANSLINAIITNKNKTCLKESIHLETEINLTDSITIEDAVVCRALVNMIDNAIEANQNISDITLRKIILKVKTKENYLYIKSINPLPGEDLNIEKTSKADKKEHGFGIKILRDFAKQYNGEYITSSENGMFISLLTLQNAT